MKSLSASSALLLALLSVLAVVALASSGLAEPGATDSKQQQQQQQPLALAQTANERQGRSVAGSGASSLNSLNSMNSIEHSSGGKSRIEQETKRQLQEFITPKNIFKSIVKLLFGSPDEISATSRHVLGMVGKMLEVLKNAFGHKSRSGTARTLRDSAEDAANAGVSMLQGYVKAVLANDDRCVQRHLCQASKEATRDGRDVGYFIASAAGYASSYLLDSSKSASFKSLHEAALKGRSLQEDCAKLYGGVECNE